MSKIRYALCARGGFLTRTQKEMINAFLREIFKYHFVSKCFELDAILDDMDKKFFVAECDAETSFTVRYFFVAPATTLTKFGTKYLRDGSSERDEIL